MAYQVFEPNQSQARYWTYAAAIRYIGMEYLGTLSISAGTCAALEELTRDKILRDVDVTGLHPLAAIERLCERGGLRFYCEHVPIADGEVAPILQFYERGKGQKVILRHQKAQSPLHLAETNVASCSVNSQNPTETLRAVGKGDLKRFEGTFELTPAWDASLEEDNYDLYSPGTNENFYAVRDVFRKYALNEAGDYGGTGYDLSEVFGTHHYSRHRRRFWPCLSTEQSGESLGYYLEISYNDGEGWWPYSGAFNVLLQECGVYVSCNQFDLDMWNAIRKNALRFRLTASVDADMPLEVELCDGPVHACRRVRSVFFDLGREFKYRQVSKQSIFHTRTPNDKLGAPDVADDGSALRGALREQLLRLRQNHMAGTAVLPWVHPGIWPGERVTGIAGRDLRFQSMTTQAETAPQIEKVIITLGQKWQTTISFGGG